MCYNIVYMLYSSGVYVQYIVFKHNIVNTNVDENETFDLSVQLNQVLVQHKPEIVLQF